MKEITLRGNAFVELGNDENMDINGGIGVVAGFFIGVVGCAAAACVDYGVKKATGKSISEHAWNVIQKIF